jgi:hypothetical protein
MPVDLYGIIGKFDPGDPEFHWLLMSDWDFLTGGTGWV